MFAGAFSGMSCVAWAQESQEQPVGGPSFLEEEASIATYVKVNSTNSGDTYLIFPMAASSGTWK
jgi:hypothetical protein